MAVKSVLKKYIFMLFYLQAAVLASPVVSKYDGKCRFKLRKGDLFDLTSLSNQIWSGKINEKEEYVFMSLCGVSQESICRDTPICIAKKKDSKWIPVIHNAGIHMQIPAQSDKRSSSKTLSVNFTGGEKCGTNSTFSTEVNFICSDEIGEPIFHLKNECNLIVDWATAAACPLNIDSVCMPHHEGLFTLWPLRHVLHYTVHTDNREFWINICDEIRGDHCRGPLNEHGAVCEMEPGTNKSKAVLGFARKKQLEYTTEGFKLTYKTQKKYTTMTEINFVCNPKKTFGELKFVLANNVTYVFEMETSLACEPEGCMVYDDGFVYNLHPLRKLKNWVIYDIRPHHDDIKYYINVCGPLNPSAEFNCSDENASACRVTKWPNGTETYVNLGYGSSKLQIENNHLVSYYGGGSPCRNSSHRWKTSITFECSEVENLPSFENESPDCVVSILWPTPVACGVKSVVGSQCSVKESLFGHVFNLNPLHHSHLDYIVIFENTHRFRLNICQPLLEPCNGQHNVSVCLEVVNKQIAIGELAVKPSFDDGRVSFILKGEPCKEGYNSSTVYIIFICSHHPEVDSGPELFSWPDNCVFYFFWHTNASCTQFKEVLCQAVDEKGHVYDLTPLSNPSANYIIYKRTPYGYNKFILNVCRSVVYHHGETCDRNSGVCLYHHLKQPGYNKRFFSLGNLPDNDFNGLKFVDGHLQLTYENGDMCLDPNSAGHMSTTIYFICLKGRSINTPTFLRNTTCNYEFEWATEYACSKEELYPTLTSEEESITNQAEHCSTVNPSTSFRFDLSTLSKKMVTVPASNGKTYKLAVCDLVAGSDCGEGIGSCVQSETGGSESAGLVNSHLHYSSPGRLFLNYTDGDECAPGVKRNTVIDFLCLVNGGNSGPYYVDTISNCTYIFHWPTNLACEREIPCKVEDHFREIDLSPLMNQNVNYRVSANGSDFFINVCHPLVPQEGLSCIGASSVCKAYPEPNGKWSHEENLGVYLSSPLVDDSNAILKYFFGSPCPRNEFNYSSSITFLCDPKAEKGSPQLKDISGDCQYQFEWKTSVVCDDVERKIDTTRIYLLYDEQHNQSINLQPLCKDDGYKVGNFILNICNTSASVYHLIGNKHISYGLLQSYTIHYAENYTELHFVEGDECYIGANTAVYEAEIRLICVPESLNGYPQLILNTSCSAVFEWSHAKACRQNGVADINSNMPKTSQSHVSTAAVLIGILLTILGCIAVLYFRKPDNRTWCRNHICGLLNKTHHGRFQYSREEWSGL